MLSDSELEALIRGSVPRELPASLRQSLTRALVPGPVRATAPMWTAIAILLLFSLIIWLSCADRSRNNPAKSSAAPVEKAAPSAPVEIKHTVHPCKASSGTLQLDCILAPPQLAGRNPANNHVMISSSHLFRDTIPLPLRLHVERHECEALVFLP